LDGEKLYITIVHASRQDIQVLVKIFFQNFKLNIYFFIFSIEYITDTCEATHTYICLLCSKFFLPSTYNMWYSMLKYGTLFIFLLYLTNYLYYKQFFEWSQTSTASDLKNRLKQVEKWHSCYLDKCMALWDQKTFRSSYQENPNDFQILKKRNQV
jgi:hypothetical protein